MAMTRMTWPPWPFLTVTILGDGLHTPVLCHSPLTILPRTSDSRCESISIPTDDEHLPALSTTS